jgi:hypothetical protein
MVEVPSAIVVRPLQATGREFGLLSSLTTATAQSANAKAQDANMRARRMQPSTVENYKRV